jgi:hypothetical protein
MSMDPNSILVGNCYRERSGAVFEVKALDNGRVTFVECKGTEGSTLSSQSLPLTKFAENLEEQVDCQRSMP